MEEYGNNSCWCQQETDVSSRQETRNLLGMRLFYVQCLAFTSRYWQAK